jgi:two-component system, cell cycle response regulator DivK
MAGELVLIVEDNERNLELVQDILELRGFRTLAATCGSQAIALAKRHNPDLVLMDVQLPDFDGVEALQRLRSDEATRSIPILALTAFAMTGDRQRFLDAGFDGYLPKPIDVRTLPDIVQQHCRADADARD